MLTSDCLVCAVLGSIRVDIVYSLLLVLTYYQFVNIICDLFFLQQNASWPLKTAAILDRAGRTRHFANKQLVVCLLSFEISCQNTCDFSQVLFEVLAGSKLSRKST